MANPALESAQGAMKSIMVSTKGKQVVDVEDYVGRTSQAEENPKKKEDTAVEENQDADDHDRQIKPMEASSGKTEWVNRIVEELTEPKKKGADGTTAKHIRTGASMAWNFASGIANDNELQRWRDAATVRREARLQAAADQGDRAAATASLVDLQSSSPAFMTGQVGSQGKRRFEAACRAFVDVWGQVKTEEANAVISEAQYRGHMAELWNIYIQIQDMARLGFDEQAKISQGNVIIGKKTFGDRDTTFAKKTLFGSIYEQQKGKKLNKTPTRCHASHSSLVETPVEHFLPAPSLPGP